MVIRPQNLDVMDDVRIAEELANYQSIISQKDSKKSPADYLVMIRMSEYPNLRPEVGKYIQHRMIELWRQKFRRKKKTAA